MVGYGEIRYHDEASFYGWGNTSEPGRSMLHKKLSTVAHQRFITAIIKQKEDVYQALQTFLVKKEGAEVPPNWATLPFR